MIIDFQKAVVYFKKTFELPLNFALEYVGNLVQTYGYALIHSENYSEALSLEKFARYYESSPDYQFLMGHIYMNNGMFAQAVESFTKCIGQKESKAEGVNSYLSNYNIDGISECLGDIGSVKQYYSQCGQYHLALNRLGSLNNGQSLMCNYNS